MISDKKIAEWVVIITICLFVFFPREMIYTSETSLGKLFFAVVVVYATTIDVIYGIAASCVVILYYQMDLHRSLVSLHRDTLLKEYMTKMQDSFDQEEEEPDQEDKNEMPEPFVAGDSTVHSYRPVGTPSNWYENSLMGSEKNSELKDIFRKTNCDDRGRLMHKGVQIRPEMTEHVFREIQFGEGRAAKCNPCDPSCKYSVVENRIIQEENMRPKTSEDDKADWLGHYIMQPINSIIEDAVAFKNRFAEYL
jgi:hypothetical protein